jgi:hypothetical protein
MKIKEFIVAVLIAAVGIGIVEGSGLHDTIDRQAISSSSTVVDHQQTTPASPPSTLATGEG